MNGAKEWTALVGRVLLAALFVISGYGKIGSFAATAGAMAGKGLPAAEVLLVLTIIVELGGGLALVIGWKTRWVAAAVLVLTVLATLVFHNFWAVPPEQATMQETHFLKNLSIIGGLALLVAFGPGRYAVDRGTG